MTKGRKDRGALHYSRGVDASELADLLGAERQLILEVGAHDGTDTEAMLAAMPGAVIHCFEPEPTAVVEFRERRDWPGRCVLHECAVGSENGDVTFYRSSGAHGGRDRWNLSGSILEPTGHLRRYPWCKFDPPTTVRCVRLDDWCESDQGIQPDRLIDLIWADVQGAEARLIRGARRVLSQTRYLYTEFSDVEQYEGQPSLDEILEMLPGFSLVATYANNALLENASPLTNGPVAGEMR